MNIDSIMEFFYERISIRVRDAVNKSGLRQEDIHSNQKLISKIINNKRDRHNRFLVIDSVFCCDIIDEETGERTSGGLLGIKELGFKNKKEILWGTDDEINEYLFELFAHLILEVFSDPKEYDLDIEEYLCDYLPYAKYSTYWNIISTNTYPAIYYAISEDKIMDNLFPSREKAIRFIYNRCEDSFRNDFFSFIKDIDTFRGIDNVFKKAFIDEKFVPLIRCNPPDSASLGLRVRHLILSDLSHTASVILEDSNINPKYSKALIGASAQYISVLEDIYSQFY
jgi:hypothetical protein